MNPSIRKLALTAHVAASVGWVGALAVFLAHALASVMSESELVVRAAAIAMGLTAWLVIMPLSVASLITGLVQALGTAWGLFGTTGFCSSLRLLRLRPASSFSRCSRSAIWQRQRRKRISSAPS